MVKAIASASKFSLPCEICPTPKKDKIKPSLHKQSMTLG
ncbi:hypothetical protein GXM_02593 [Nostoc sphaeroides CCNUC1]|uniref:Uncharacterized protein n=1 Tax=Nostoc sphaeroides CCNUC1 TaxID=2653204 RepID=A0A5P8VYB0_9NOSO|nr:hypothetical protein GXM_02593 [Nostoc sphaeroides CCNUC1]